MKTILFDLDGTLLPMDQDEFIKAYFGGLATKLVPFGYEPQTLIKGIWAGTAAMIQNNGDTTNEEAFWATAAKVLGTDCRKDEPLFDEYYRNEFQFVSFSCGKNPQAAEVIRFLKAQGCQLVLATNPIFPAIATRRRMQWAGLQEADFRLVTTYENSRHCKPNPQYYQDILDAIGEKGENCIMVGNDATEDMVAAMLGMKVFLLTDCLINKDRQDIDQYPHGSFPELLDFLQANMLTSYKKVHQQCYHNADGNACEHLQKRMAHEHFQLHFRDFFPNDIINRMEDLAQKHGMLTGFLPNTGSIVANNDGQHTGDGKFHRTGTKMQGAGSGQRCHCSGMTTRHTAIAEQSFNIPFFRDNEIDKHLNDLCHGPSRHRNHRKGIRQPIN